MNIKQKKKRVKSMTLGMFIRDTDNLTSPEISNTFKVITLK